MNIKVEQVCIPSCSKCVSEYACQADALCSRVPGLQKLHCHHWVKCLLYQLVIDTDIGELRTLLSVVHEKTNTIISWRHIPQNGVQKILFLLLFLLCSFKGAVSEQVFSHLGGNQVK